MLNIFDNLLFDILNRIIPTIYAYVTLEINENRTKMSKICRSMTEQD